MVMSMDAAADQSMGSPEGDANASMSSVRLQETSEEEFNEDGQSKASGQTVVAKQLAQTYSVGSQHPGGSREHSAMVVSRQSSVEQKRTDTSAEENERTLDVMNVEEAVGQPSRLGAQQDSLVAQMRKIVEGNLSGQQQQQPKSSSGDSINNPTESNSKASVDSVTQQRRPKQARSHCNRHHHHHRPSVATLISQPSTGQHQHQHQHHQHHHHHHHQAGAGASSQQRPHSHGHSHRHHHHHHAHHQHHHHDHHDHHEHYEPHEPHEQHQQPQEQKLNAEAAKTGELKSSTSSVSSSAAVVAQQGLAQSQSTSKDISPESVANENEAASNQPAECSQSTRHHSHSHSHQHQHSHSHSHPHHHHHHHHHHGRHHHHRNHKKRLVDDERSTELDPQQQLSGEQSMPLADLEASEGQKPLQEISSQANRTHGRCLYHHAHTHQHHGGHLAHRASKDAGRPASELGQQQQQLEQQDQQQASSSHRGYHHHHHYSRHHNHHHHHHHGQHARQRHRNKNKSSSATNMSAEQTTTIKQLEAKPEDQMTAANAAADVHDKQAATLADCLKSASPSPSPQTKKQASQDGDQLDTKMHLDQEEAPQQSRAHGGGVGPANSNSAGQRQSGGRREQSANYVAVGMDLSPQDGRSVHQSMTSANNYHQAESAAPDANMITSSEAKGEPNMSESNHPSQEQQSKALESDVGHLAGDAGRRDSSQGFSRDRGGSLKGNRTSRQLLRQMSSSRENSQQEMSGATNQQVIECEPLPVANFQSQVQSKQITQQSDAQPDKRCRLCWCCCCPCSGLSSRNLPSKNETKANAEPSASNTNKCPSATNVSLDEIRAWGESFDRLMKCPEGRKVFQDFLRCEYSEENILFWIACEELKSERDAKCIANKARDIYEDYISILSAKEVSLDSRVRDIINNNIKKPSSNIFDEAQLQIYTLMHRDSYPRFINSSMYKKLAQIQTTSRKSSS